MPQFFLWLFGSPHRMLRSRASPAGGIVDAVSRRKAGGNRLIHARGIALALWHRPGISFLTFQFQLVLCTPRPWPPAQNSRLFTAFGVFSGHSVFYESSDVAFRLDIMVPGGEPISSKVQVGAHWDEPLIELLPAVVAE